MLTNRTSPKAGTRHAERRDSFRPYVTSSRTPQGTIVIHRLALVLSLSAAPLLSRAAAPEQRPAVPPSAREAAKTPTSSDKPSGPAAPVAPAAKPAAATTTPEAAPPKGPGEMRAVLEAPLFSEAFRSVPIASIDGEPIALVQLTDALALSHTGRQEVQTREHDFHPVLDRLLNLKLCAIEARDMGLDKLPEVADQIRVFHEQMLQDFLRGESTKDVKSDPAEVERFFKDAVREWKVRSLLFEKEEDAKAFAAAAEGGKKFDAIAKPLLDAKKATGTLEAEFTPTAQLQPRVTQALAATEKGAITAPLRVQQGWTVLQVVDVRYPDVHHLQHRPTLLNAQRRGDGALLGRRERLGDPRLELRRRREFSFESARGLLGVEERLRDGVELLAAFRRRRERLRVLLLLEEERPHLPLADGVFEEPLHLGRIRLHVLGRFTAQEVLQHLLVEDPDLVGHLGELVEPHVARLDRAQLEVEEAVEHGVEVMLAGLNFLAAGVRERQRVGELHERDGLAVDAGDRDRAEGLGEERRLEDGSHLARTLRRGGLRGGRGRGGLRRRRDRRGGTARLVGGSRRLRRFARARRNGGSLLGRGRTRQQRRGRE